MRKIYYVIINVFVSFFAAYSQYMPVQKIANPKYLYYFTSNNLDSIKYQDSVLHFKMKEAEYLSYLSYYHEGILLDKVKQKKEKIFHFRVIVTQYNYIDNQHTEIYDDAYQLYYNAGINLMYLLQDSIEQLEKFVFPYDRFRELELIQEVTVRNHGGKWKRPSVPNPPRFNRMHPRSLPPTEEELDELKKQKK